MCIQIFFAYQSGVYVYTNGTYVGGHCIKMIGWGVVQATGLKYWICQNSWGNWGMNGFFYIERGVNMCEIEDEVYSILPTIL